MNFLDKLINKIKNAIKYAGQPYSTEQEKKVYDNAYKTAKFDVLRDMGKDKAKRIRERAKEAAKQRKSLPDLFEPRRNKKRKKKLPSLFD